MSGLPDSKPSNRPLDPREYDYRRLRREAVEIDGGCPNGPDEDGNWPCDPKGYFGVAECQVCGRIGTWQAPVIKP